MRWCSMKLALSLLLVEAAWADPLVVFDFGRDLTTTQKVAQVTGLTPLRAALSTAIWDDLSGSARASTWQSTTATNYFRFSFDVAPGYVLDISSIQFDYLSQKIGTLTNGPTQYEVRVGTNGAAFRSFSGGFKTLTADGAWHRGVAADNGGVSMTNLSGYVVIGLAGKGASDKSARWSLDNIIVVGQARAQTRLPIAPRLEGLVPHSQVRFSNIVSSQFYSLQYASGPISAWKWHADAANLTSGGPEIVADVQALNGPSVFVRGVTSFGRMPSVDLAGYWRVTSTNPPFGGSVIQFDQAGSGMSFESSLVGGVADNTFTIRENGAPWISGVVTGDTLRGTYSVPLSGMAATNSFVAVRYTGAMYDVWQGTNLLTASQYYNPGSNGYTRIGQASGTATFTVTQPYLVVCANTVTPVDSLEGPEGGYVDDATMMSVLTGNTKDPGQLKGRADLATACVGTGYTSQPYRGYAAFGPVSWASLTVNIGSLNSPAPAPTVFPTNLLRQSFRLVHDSDGMAPTGDAEMVLFFEPGGVAQLYVAEPDYAYPYRGTYGYTNGQISLKFTDTDFHPDVKFALDLTNSTVTMPFDVFTSGTTGPSLWRREVASISHTMWMIFIGASVNEALPVDQGIARARAYADAVLVTARRAVAKGAPEYPLLLSTETLRGGVRLNYNFGDGSTTTMDVDLVGRWPTPVGTPLGTSPLYADPRVHLNVTAGRSGVSDPSQKTALLILPLYTKRVLSRDPHEPVSVTDNDQEVLGMDGIAQKLSAHGYEVRWLCDEQVNVVNLIRELMASPGLIYYAGHGCTDGRVNIGTYFGVTNHFDAAMVEYNRQKALVAAAGYADLLNHRYNGQTPLGFTVLHNGMTGKEEVGMVGIKPGFWDWLRQRGADFGESLVYIGACQTSETPDLRYTIRARALFSFSEEVSQGTLGAVGRYLVESLVRTTRSAEETYYNLRRVVNTHQMIYAEDARLNGFTDWGDGTTLAAHIHAYAALGPNNTSGLDGIMELNDLGWLGGASSGRFAAGDVWWVLFGGRWGQNAQSGSQAVMHCWNDFWSLGHGAGLADTFCQNCSPGTLPNQDVVAYATYLLTGQAALPFSGVTCPRWTLNDGAP
jgi:hypothetical protein